MSVVPQLGAESTFEALGKKWTTGRWTLAVWDELVALAKPHLPDPYEGLKELLPILPQGMVLEVVMEAQKAKRRILGINSPEVQEWLATAQGRVLLLYTLLKQNHPDITPDDVLAISQELSAQEQEEIAARAAGEPPPAKNPLAPAA